MSILLCPHCNQPLQDTGNRSYACEQNHHFDLSKEGYLNLLPVNKKKSKDPGDNAEMVLARRNFLEKGFYDPMMKEVQTLLPQTNTMLQVLDAGCGEGYYSKKVFESIPTQVLGTDISKHAVKKAAKKYRDHFYFVSSIYQLPIAANSIDVILSIFSPLYSAEFDRILKANGRVIVVSPGPNHMKELAELLYDRFQPHETKIEASLQQNFQQTEEKSISFSIHLPNNESILDYLRMTPYLYSTSEERLEKLKQLPELTVSCDFKLFSFEKKVTSE